MEKSFIIPSVFEENNIEYARVANSFLDGMRLVDLNGKNYIVGDFALKEGVSPHKFLNSSSNDLDYQVLSHAALAIASMGKYDNLVITAGFPNTTYQSFRKEAQDFYSGKKEIKIDSQLYGGRGIERMAVSIEHSEIMTELDGCIKAIREGSSEKENFFIASLGYGTFEIAMSTPFGTVQRTAFSTMGIHYAVNIVMTELQKTNYLNLLTEQQIERAFQKGKIVLNRQRVDIKELRTKALTSYYNEIISPAIKRKFSSVDYMETAKMYLVGGGAMYQDIVDLFNNEFSNVLDVIVYPEPYLCASKGYCLNSKRAGKDLASGDKAESTAYVGIDLGNSNTVITVQGV
jgi:actin-like ATPase involved in cell morphogenesis